MWLGVLNATVYAVAMAYLESAIVVYLRRLYYPKGFDFPLVIIDIPTLLIEVGRETATMVMLATVGVAAGRTKVGKWAYFLYLFGVWDIFYYVWLKVFLDWPASLFTWDVLFLIPVPWVGPVLAPVTVALTMIGMALVLLHLEQRGPVLPAGKTVWLAQVDSLANRHYFLHHGRGAASPRQRHTARTVDARLLPLVDAAGRSGAGDRHFCRMGVARLVFPVGCRMKIVVHRAGDGLRHPRHRTERVKRCLADLLQTPKVP